jgi:hypothetical protein
LIEDQRDGMGTAYSSLKAVARRLQDSPLQSPETSRNPEGPSDLNISLASLAEERDTAGVLETRTVASGKESPPTYAVAAARATSVVAAAPATEERIETEEGAEPVFRLPPTPPPWSKHFSSHHRRVLCTVCFAGNREIWNAKCSDCYRVDREKRKEALQK